jgi:putative tricarboxylic transport membrane protein
VRKLQLNQEHFIGIACIAIALITYKLTTQFPRGMGKAGAPGPEFFPHVLAVLLTIFGIMEVILGFVHQSRHEHLNIKHLAKQLTGWGGINVFLIIGLMIFYVSLFEFLGFILTTFIILVILMWRLRVKWWKNLAATVTLILVIQLLFGKLFTISLPYGVLSGIIH